MYLVLFCVVVGWVEQLSSPDSHLPPGRLSCHPACFILHDLYIWSILFYLLLYTVYVF